MMKDINMPNKEPLITSNLSYIFNSCVQQNKILANQVSDQVFLW